jgi:uncharacterized protein
MAFRNPAEDRIRDLLACARTLAVVGLSPKTDRPSFHVASQMQRFGYRIIPVRPGVDAVLGERAYPDLYAVTEPIDLVNVFRAPEQVDPVVDACIARGLRTLWLQDGGVNVPAAERAVAAGIEVVMNRCVYRDYLAFFGVVKR